MGEKYIRKNNAVVKNSKTYAKLDNQDDAIAVRDLLVSADWNLDEIPKYIINDDNYLVLAVIEDKVHLIAKYKSLPDDETILKLIKKRMRNPNNSRYGLNIVKVFDTFTIKKQIAGDDYIFGYFDNLEDCEFIRNFLMDNDWNVNSLEDIEFDEDTNSYKVVKVVDDKAYVLDSFKSKDEIDLNKTHAEFLVRISKHKYGLSNHPHLELLTDKIKDLEDEWGVKADDGYWSFENLNDSSQALDDIIFKLTPFEMSIYDAIGQDTSLDEIKRTLIRFKSGNFDEKILKNIESLKNRNLIIEVRDNIYTKRLFQKLK